MMKLMMNARIGHYSSYTVSDKATSPQLAHHDFELMASNLLASCS